MTDSRHSLSPDLRYLIDSVKVMTLAVPWEGGAWSAPVYYIYSNGDFWFFSSPDSRHISGSESDHETPVAASIYMDDDAYDNIRGVQMRGRIEAGVRRSGKEDQNSSVAGNNILTIVEDSVDVAMIALAYIGKFGIPFKASSGRSGASDALAFIQQRYRSKFYRFVPTEMIYMDNRLHVGFKQKIIL